MVKHQVASSPTHHRDRALSIGRSNSTAAQQNDGRLVDASEFDDLLRSLPVYANAGLSRSGVSGARRRRTPVASKTALAMAAATGRIELSPAPAGGNSARFSSTMSTVSGASVMSRIG